MAKQKNTKNHLLQRTHNTPPGVVHQESLVEVYQGPLPPSSELKKYEAHKGVADRIISMAESRQEHIIDMDQKHLSGASRHQREGQYMAFIIALFGLGAASWLVVSGYGWGGGGVGLLGVSIILSQFLKRR